MASDPFSFIYPNVRIHMNVFEAASAVGVRRVVCVGSTTGYRDSPEPVHEDEYLDGELHPAYFVPGNAHRFIKRISMMHKDLETVFFRPSNVYGPGNSFDRQHAHVIEATVRKVAERMDPFIVWGTGTEIRDAIYIDDLARAIAAHGANCAPGDYNVGVGEEMSVNAIVRALCEHAKFSPDIKHDLTKPTAISARRVDCDKLKALGWRAQVPMRDGLARTYDWYLGQTG
jgi:GDP-L-fucose synthase